MTVAVATKLTTPIYEAVSLIQLLPRAGQEVDVNAVVSFDEAGYLERRDRARTQIQVILSRSVRLAVVEAYNADGYDDLTGTAGAGALKGMMTIGPREDTQIVEIMVAHTDPERAAKLANLIAEVYRKQNLSARTEAARETRVWLEGRTDTYREDLAVATQSLIEFRVQNDLIDIDEDVDDISRRMTALQRALGEVTTEHALLESTLVEHRRLLADGQHDVLVSAFESPALRALSEQHALVRTETAEVFARYGELHPRHKQAAQRGERVAELIEEEVSRLVEGERSELRILARQLRRLDDELDQVKTELLQRQRLQDAYENIKMEEESLRRLYGSLSDRGTEVEFQASTQLNDVRILDPAVPPGRPARPSLPLNMVVAVLVGVAGGLGLALLRNRFDDTLRSVAQVEAVLDVPLLGTLPLLPAALSQSERALYPQHNPQSPTAETLRAIRALLHAAPMSRGPKTLVVMAHRRFLVTSSQHSEGKTDAALGLAFSFARLGIATVIIDADMRRPQLHTLLAVEQEPGLADALVDVSEDVLELVEPTRFSDLYVLPCGGGVDAPQELLAGPRWQALLTRLGGRYPVVIIDAPPVIPFPDALVMSAGTDVIMMVRSGVVREEHALRTLERLRRAGAKVRGTVLTGVKLKGDASYYYYEQPATPEQPGEPAAR